ncbi:MAG: lytic transglycosylase domain-containing protein [Saprospiraceae bacterium]
MRLIYIIQSILIALFVSLLVLFFFSYTKPKSFDFDPITQKIKGIRNLSSLQFAGEEVPLKLPDVAERLERELLSNTYQHTSTLLHLKLANRYLPIAERIFKEEGLPDDLKYIAVAESSLRNAISLAGAKGIWQFKEDAAKELGLTINEYVDERNHFEKATRAAAQYLKKQELRFNSWALACAAYNMGPTALASAMKEQLENSYYDLNLSDETNRYLFRIIAIKEIMTFPEKFGFMLDETDCYVKLDKFYEIKIDSSISSLAQFAHDNGISYRELKIYNPWLLKSSLINKSGSSFYIRIPN